MIRCKINFDMIRYSVIFAANLYLLISSDILNFFFMNVVILVCYILRLKYEILKMFDYMITFINEKLNNLDD